LFALIVTASHARAAHAADRVDFIDEDDGRRRFLCHLEKVAHAGSADAHKHLHKFGTGNREERYARFARYRACEQCLTRSRCAHEKNAFRDARADIEKFLRVAEEVDNLNEFFFRFFSARDISEGHALAGVGRINHARLRLSEGKRLHAGSPHLPREEPKENAEENHGEHKGRERLEPEFPSGIGNDGH